MRDKFDAIVIGLGSMGSAAAYHLARRGLSVLGLEQFDLVHTKGSHHGATRLIRKAYFEHPDYVPLIERASQLWGDLEEQAQRELLVQSGVVIFAPPESAVLAGVRHSAALHELPIEEVRAELLAERFPDFALPKDYEAIFEADSGFLHVEAGVRAHLDAAREEGAVLLDNKAVLAWNKHAQGIDVVCEDLTYCCKQLLLCAGAWSASLSDVEHFPIQVHRQIQAWFKGREGFDVKSGSPCFAFDLPQGFHYGFPDIDGSGIKFACHEKGLCLKSADERDASGIDDEVKALGGVLEKHVPGVSKAALRARECLYTMTPDQHFIIDQHPEAEQVFLATGFSGHGYKFAPVIGEQLAELMCNGAPSIPMDFLKLRF
ncbi:MAG: N-methyl-L-tryptophan oxidase [Myxococcota bacterium]|nr:N-methyl-L-tryptophan oxidase [Myxococcota bacterium]